MQQEKPRTGHIVLLAASLVSAALGSLHAFSVFLDPLEQLFGAPRSSVSLTYSLALLSLTFAVLMGPRYYSRWTASQLMAVVCILAAGGALLAGFAPSLLLVWLGYSLVFGLANGLGYGFGLQIAAQENPGREGLAMGVVTAAYAFGAVISPILFDMAVAADGFRAALVSLAGTLVGVGLLSGLLFRSVSATFQADDLADKENAGSHPGQILLWLGYFGGVLAGLMVIGHAAGISASLRPDLVPWLAPATIAACNLVGSLAGGRLVDRSPLAVVLAGLALLTSVSIAALAVFGALGGTLIGFGMIGFAYGGTIAAYPAAIAKLFGMQNSARIYGRVFTAWGGAGLAGPWLAGFLFDKDGDYQIALLVAATFGLMSAGAILVLFGRRQLHIGQNRF